MIQFQPQQTLIQKNTSSQSLYFKYLLNRAHRIVLAAGSKFLKERF